MLLRLSIECDHSTVKIKVCLTQSELSHVSVTLLISFYELCWEGTLLLMNLGIIFVLFGTAKCRLVSESMVNSMLFFE
jgi:hypothetical protein